MDEAAAPPIEAQRAGQSAEIRDTVERLGASGTLGRAAGLLPRLSFFTRAQQRSMLKDSSFTVDHDWQPKPTAAVFIVARKAA